MNYVVFELGKHQFKASPGEEILVNRLSYKKDSHFEIDKILLWNNQGQVLIGQPYISGVYLKCQLVDCLRGEKIRVAKFRAKSRYRRTSGHRQSLSKIKVLKILKSTDKNRHGQDKSRQDN